MKLKTYLIISHLLVLLTPILTVCILYQANSAYNKRTEVKDYLASSIELFKYEELLDKPELYLNPDQDMKLEELEANENVEVVLYDANGKSIYSTVPGYEYMLSREGLYKNLNEIQHTYNTDTLKKLVFDEGHIVGFYKITIARENLKNTIRYNIILSCGCFILVNILIFGLAIRMINKRFNEPIKRVIRSMNDYAKGNSEVHITYRASDEIGELCAHFNEMKDNLEKNKHLMEQEQKAKEYMIATISHDLKTPLTAIRAYTEMFKLGDVKDEVRYEEYLSTILNKCDYMKDMLDDLLTYNLLTMEYDLGLVEVEGEEFCDMLFSGIEGMCEAKHLSLEQAIEVHDDYLVNVKYMTRVVDNIVSNAIRHTPDYGKIWMGAFSTNVKLPEWVHEVGKEALEKYKTPGMWLLIINQGIPIAERERESLFKPFYQGDEARSKKEHKGVGLGLSISKMIMSKHGGAIEVVPIPEVGNMMVCYLPSITSNRKGEENE
ncbi:sensor histidine kinase [Cellulosilyticum sp. WCF-2]|uniref:sensor histidine kinase n=1 Tax=Cellulosilyticum sp. WCF-2 TaxID=2497860 RepID=UPI000F8C8D92|nr:HAMP domain-containing sensor histidine kinase [Cellulosilyticum sp. WCF-2]QEH67542.1 HAMP domain-containing histidine kinase [Cellulosilyticum sp. WCF-2]